MMVKNQKFLFKYSCYLRVTATRISILVILLSMVSFSTIYAQTHTIDPKPEKFEWIQTARVFLMDAYQPPFAPKLEFDAELLAETMADMNANVVRIATMGKYATIQGIRFSTHPDQGDRDLLAETIEACKPRGIKVIPYISTGHKLAWSMVTEEYPEYAQKTTPDGLPDRSHMYVGEDHGTVCWMTPYREAFMDYVEHVVRDYDIDGIYFDKWTPHYFWPGKQLCYCDGCKNGFRETTGLEIPYHENEEDYSHHELRTIDKYHEWYLEKYITTVVLQVHKLVKSYKDIPLISNINTPEVLANLDPRIINSMDAFLYERGRTMLERAEGVSVPRSLGQHIWPYIGVYHNWPRLAFQGLNYQQEIFTNLMFGGGAIIAQPTGYMYNNDHREYVSYPFEVIKMNEEKLRGLNNFPHIGVVFGYSSPQKLIQKTWYDGSTDTRTSTLGAFSACLYGHVQVSSLTEFVLDDPNLLKKYPVLYLANISFLSDERIKNIRDYVSNGGNLVASYATSLFDEKGDRQTKFGLEDLLKVSPENPSGELSEIIKSYRSMVGGPNDLYLLTTEEGNATFREDWQERLFPCWFYQPVKVLEGGKVLMNIVTGPDQKPILPGIVMSGYGKGNVIYCASALESFYYTGGQDIVQDLILKFVASVSKTPSPYTMEAPASVIANLTTGKNRIVLHLTNWTGNKLEVPLKNEYYLAPVENVRLKIVIPEGSQVKNVSTLVKTDFSKELKGNQLEVSLPRVEAYQGIVVDLK